GAIGYPNLADDIWHWGGEPERVLQTVMEGREGIMPPWGQVLTGMGGEHAVDYVVAYVRALHDPALARNNFMAAQGKQLDDGVCVACHGVDGKGNQELGAPDLTDDYWLYGDSSESLRKTITEGRHGSMPAHGELLGPTRSRLVAAWVWSLSNTPAQPVQEAHAGTRGPAVVRPPAAPDGAAGGRDPLAQFLRRGRGDHGVLRLRRPARAARHVLPAHGSHARRGLH